MKPAKILLALAALALGATSLRAADTPQNCGCSCCEGEAVCCCARSGGKPTDTATAVREALRQRFDRPDAPLSVDPVVVEGDHVIAGWWQAKIGGRVLLEKRDGTWTPVLCAGAALREEKVLRKAGLTEAEARSLVEKARKAEATLDPARRAQLDLFPRTVSLEQEPNS